MSFLDDYLLYNSGNEAHEKYHLWAGLSLLASVVSRKMWTKKSDPRKPEAGHYSLTIPNIYVLLVGEPGNRKTTARDEAYSLYMEVCKDSAVVTAERMSPEAITKYMAEEQNLRYFVDPKTQEKIEYRPLSCFCTELKYFLGQNPLGMMELLTAIYDRRFLDVKMKNAGTDLIVNPCVTLLASETPNWIKTHLKLRVIDGGIVRRIIPVYETEEVKRIAFPSQTKTQAEAYARCRSHLHKIKDLVGEFQWSKEAADFWEPWYLSLKYPDDPTMRGWYRSKDTLGLKIAMLLTVAEYDFQFILTPKRLATAIAMLDELEPNMIKLFGSSGLNPLAEPGYRMVECVIASGGFMPKMRLQTLMYPDLGEKFGVTLQHFIDTQQLFILENKDWVGPDGKKQTRILVATLDGVKKLRTQQTKI